MRINNVSASRSIQPVVWSSIIMSCIIALYVFFYCITKSEMNFFQWLVSNFKALMAEEGLIFAIILMILLPVTIFIWFVSSINERNKAMQKFNTGLNLKYVDFWPDRVNFVFNQPQCNIVCGYNEIKSLTMIINTHLVRTKHGYYTAVKEIELKFTILNNKELSLTNVPLNMMKFLYLIVDYGRSVDNFSYKFEGAGEIEDIKEKIDDYMNKGFKQILATGMENTFKILSIIFFGLGIFFILTFKDILNTGAWIIAGAGFIPFITISFILDIFLLADKMRERKYRF